LTPSLILRPHLATLQILISVNNRKKISTHKKHFSQNSRALLFGFRSKNFWHYIIVRNKSRAMLRCQINRLNKTDPEEPYMYTKRPLSRHHSSHFWVSLTCTCSLTW
jgi:hypothetical protein